MNTQIRTGQMSIGLIIRQRISGNVYQVPMPILTFHDLRIRNHEIVQILGTCQQRTSLVGKIESPCLHPLFGSGRGGMIQWLLDYLNLPMHGNAITMTDQYVWKGMLRLTE